MDSALFASFLATQGAPLLNSDATAYTLGGEQGQVTLQFLQDLTQDGCAVWETEAGTLADLSAGKILFAVGSTDELPLYRRTIAEGANFDWALSALPHATKETLVGVRGSSLTILRGSPKEQLAAWLFVKWLSEPEQQAYWSQETARFPIRKSALSAMDAYLAENPQYGLAAQLLEDRWITEPAVTAYSACRAEIGRMLYAVTAGESVEQWLSDTLTRCSQTLEEGLP
jgi:ABC-type glycerol-3-phosphate transport system substrate-binding protein